VKAALRCAALLCATFAVSVSENALAQCLPHCIPSPCGAVNTTPEVLKGYEGHIPGSTTAHHGTAVHQASCEYRTDCTVVARIREDGSGAYDDQFLDALPGWYHSIDQTKLHCQGTSTPMGSSSCTAGTAFAVDGCWFGCNVTISAEIRGGGIEVQLANHLWAEGGALTHTCGELQHRRDDDGGGCGDGPDTASDCCPPGEEEDCNSSGGEWDSGSCTCEQHEHDPGPAELVGQETTEICTCECLEGYSCTQFICQETTYYYETRCTFDNEVVESWDDTPSPVCDGGEPIPTEQCCAGYAPSKRRIKKPIP
jgi:hypothetical protein